MADPGRPGVTAGRPRLFNPVEWRVRVARLTARSARLADAEPLYRYLLARRPESVAALTGLGRLLLRARRYDEAVRIWQQAADLQPERVFVLFSLARALHRSGRIEEAAEKYLAVLALDPGHEKALSAHDQLSRRFVRFKKAEPARNAEELAAAIANGALPLVASAPEAALTQFRLALSVAPDELGALRGAAECLDRLEQYEEALQLWERVAVLQPEGIEASLQIDRLRAALEPGRAVSQPDRPVSSARAKTGRQRPKPEHAALELDGINTLLRLARSTYSQGRLDQTEIVSRRILSLDGLNTPALLLLSRLYLRENKVSDAVQTLTQLCAIDQQAIEPRQLLGRALLQENQLEAALQIYQELRTLQPGSLDVVKSLGLIHGRLNEWDAAASVYQELLDGDSRAIPVRLAYARALQQSGRVAEAEAQLQAVLTREPDHSDTLVALARLQSKSDPESAFMHWTRLAALNGRSVEPPLQMARIRLRQNRPVEALPLFETVLRLDPSHPEALASYGHALSDSDPDAAVRHFMRWIEQRPEDVAPRLELGRLYQRLRQPDRAETVYREILERDPEHHQVLSRLADLLARDHNRIEDALQLWRKVGERESTAALAALQRGGLLDRAGRLNEAEAEYRGGIDRAPEDVALLFGLARLLAKERRWVEAVEFYERLLELDASRVDALLGYGRCLDGLNRDEDALLSYERVLALDPANANALLYRGRLLRQLGRIDEAIAQWQTVVARSPQNGAAWQELVFVLATAERESEALAVLDAARAALPACAETWVRLGDAARAGQFQQQAIEYYERAIAAEPDAAAHHTRLGECYFNLGILDGAFRALLRSRELEPANVPVAKRVVDIIHTINAVGLDHVELSDVSGPTGQVLVPERLFQLVRQIADRDVAPYDPVPRRVVAVSASLAPGGAERQLVNMLLGLAAPDRELDVALFCISLAQRGRRDFFLPLLAGTPVDIVTPDAASIAAAFRDPEVARHARLIRAFPEDMIGPIAFWLREFRQRRPQVVHAWQDSTNLTAAVAALLAGVPRLILTARSVRPDNPRRRLKRFMNEAYRAFVDHPTVVMANNSRAGALDYADWLDLDANRIEVIYNGIDFEQLERSVDLDAPARVRRDLGIPESAPVLGSVFRMSEEKRPLLWVETAAVVAGGLPNAHFIVCGDGPMRTEMAELAARLGIADRLHLPGPQSNIASWYKAMDIVMLTSRHEGLPNVLLEAQCLGLPVVAPDVGGMSEVVSQGVTGWTVPDADAAALAERVLFCLGDPGWRDIACEEAPSFVKDRFSIAAMLQRTLEVYGLDAAI